MLKITLECKFTGQRGHSWNLFYIHLLSMKSIHGHSFIVHQFWAFILKYFLFINICIFILWHNWIFVVLEFTVTSSLFCVCVRVILLQLGFNCKVDSWHQNLNSIFGKEIKSMTVITLLLLWFEGLMGLYLWAIVECPKDKYEQWDLNRRLFIITNSIAWFGNSETWLLTCKLPS